MSLNSVIGTICPNGYVFVNSPWIQDRNSTAKVLQYFIDYEKLIQVEKMTSIRHEYVEVDLTFKIVEISMSSPRGFFNVILMWNRHNI